MIAIDKSAIVYTNSQKMYRNFLIDGSDDLHNNLVGAIEKVEVKE